MADEMDNTAQQHPLFALRGFWRELFEALGGGEKYLERERAEFNANAEEREARLMAIIEHRDS